MPFLQATRPLVAREDELAALRSALRHAAEGHTTTVLVAGDAGAGKSRLVAELAAGLAGRAALVLVGHCVELGNGELPSAPVAGALRALAAQLDATELDEVLGPAREVLARLVPGLGGPAAAAGAFDTARLFELLLGVLGRRAPAGRCCS